MKLFFIIIFLLSCTTKTKTTLSCKKNLPFQMEGCEGEACKVVYEKYPSAMEVKLYKNPDLNSEIVDTIHQCEKFKDLKQFLIVSNFNETKVTKVGDQFKKYNIQLGDPIQITHYTGEGTWGACVGVDTIEGIGIKGENPMETYEEVEFLNKEVKRPKPWVYVTSIRNKSGWTDKTFWQGKYDDEQFLVKKCKIK